jgi:hemolysin III
MAAGGIIFKLLWLDAPRWLGTGVYVAMGWGALIPGWKVLPMLDGVALAWLFGGGLFYSVGAVIYGTKRPDPWPGVFGFHEVWHVFVIAGAACHYALVFSFCAGPCLPL